MMSPTYPPPKKKKTEDLFYSSPSAKCWPFSCRLLTTPTFRRRLSSVLSKFSQKINFSRCHPPRMMSPGADRSHPSLVTPLWTAKSHKCFRNLKMVDSRLFNRIQSPSHCLSHLLPPEKHHFGLPPGGHSYALPICPHNLYKRSFVPMFQRLQAVVRIAAECGQQSTVGHSKIIGGGAHSPRPCPL